MTGIAPEHVSFSVIVASRHRPDLLRQCIRALKQLDHPNFEIVVVTDRESLSVCDDPHVRCIGFDDANLSAARNLGVRHAGGEICAFVDDDAVPEPMWLRYLEDAFAKTEAVAVVGYVRGRNGISYQSRLSSIDSEAETHQEDPPDCEPSVPQLGAGRAVKLVGTNFAIRRDALSNLGGFDESYRFFLEDSDLSMRLEAVGARVAVAPLAQVHHGFASSSRRSALRAPLDLSDIGRSTAIFLRKHTGEPTAELWERLMLRERRRLIRHLTLGTIEPRELDKRLKELKNGWSEGMNCRLGKPTLELDDAEFRRVPPYPSGHVILASCLLSKRRSLLQQANRIASNGDRVSVFSFSLTLFRHHVRYVGDGVWLQTGGIYGRSIRQGCIAKWCRFAERVKVEAARVAKPRGISETTSGKWWGQTR